MSLVIVGMGYVGLPLALEFSKSGIHVIGYDIDARKIENLNSGISHIEDVTSEDIRLQLGIGNLSFSLNQAVFNDADYVIIAVPTPLTNEGEPELSFLENASETIGQNLKKPSLIINESTSYPGTLRDLISKRVDLFKSYEGDNFYAVAPERVDPGNKIWNIRNTPRLIGGLTEEARRKTVELYSLIVDNIEEVDTPEVAESAKLFENTYRQVNIALVNELAIIMDSLGIPARKVISAASSKPYGFMAFDPGIGVGGHCIPVDPTYLSYAANKKGVEASFIKLANEINRKMPSKVIEIAQKVARDDFSNKKILLCGISYKSDVSDLRESPATEILDLLINIGADVTYYDPLITEFNGRKSWDLTKNDFDYALITVAHKSLAINTIAQSAKVVLDATGKYPNFIQII